MRKDSLSTPKLSPIFPYSLAPTLKITRNGQSRQTGHPYSLFAPPGHGLLIVRVRDEQGRGAKTLTLTAP